MNHRARVRDETRHISYARARQGRRAWWEGFLGSYYKIALPLGLRPTPLSV